MRKGKNENLNLYSRGPALSGLNGEQGEHGRGHVVVVELLLGPLPADHHRGLSGFLAPLEIFSLYSEVS